MKKLSDKEEKIIINLYKTGQTVKNISKDVNRHYDTVRAVLKRNGIKLKSYKFPKKYSINNNYFKNINTQNKAYFLGLMAADGWISEDRLGITLQKRDRFLIDSFIKDIKYSGEPYLIKRKQPHHRDGIRFSVRNKKIIKNLIDKGVVYNKSLILEFPNKNMIPNIFLKDYIRGFMDGDGCVRLHHGLPVVRFVGTENFLKGIQKVFIKYCGIKAKKMYQANKNKNTFELSYNSISDCVKIYGFLYEDANIFLDRKRKILKGFIKNRLKDFKKWVLKEVYN